MKRAFFPVQALDNRPIGRPGKMEEAARLVIDRQSLARTWCRPEKFQKVISIGGGCTMPRVASGEGSAFTRRAFTAVYLMKNTPETG